MEPILTKEQYNLSRKNNHLAWKLFYPEGNGKAKHGYALHHIDMSLRYNNIERYIQWNKEDLQMLTLKDHNLIHKKHELMRENSDKAHKDSHHYFNVNTNEQKMFKDCPNDDWQPGLLHHKDGSLIIISQIGEENGMFMKSAYEGKNENELTEIRKKKQMTFASKTQEERDIINGRRGGGTPVICITTR